MHYVLFKKEDSETLWGAWECDGNTGNTEWNVKNVDCDTANAKYVKKSGDNEPTWCEINGHEQNNKRFYLKTKTRGNQLLFLMNTLITSTFSCTFEEFKNDVSTLFLEEMCKEFVTDYEFVKVNEHKSHLLMNCTDLEKLGAEMESPFAKEWDKKNNCKDTVYSIELVE